MDWVSKVAVQGLLLFKDMVTPNILTFSWSVYSGEKSLEPYDPFCNAKSTYRHQLFRCEGHECFKEFKFRAEFVGSLTLAGIGRGADVAS